MLAGPSPEVLIAGIAAATSTMRVGSGGVMLPHYSPLKVAETFSVLSGLYGDRIDLGIGRAPGTDPQTSFALQRDRRYHAIDDFPEQLAELTAYLDDSFPSDHPALAHRRDAAGAGCSGRGCGCSARRPERDLGGGELGLPYSFADFINPSGAEIAAVYRDRFVPSAHLAAPELSIAVSAICAETDEEAKLLASSARMAFVQLRRGRPGAIPTVEEAGDVPLADRALRARDVPATTRGRLARARSRGARGGGRGVRGGRGRGGHDRARSRGPAAILRS